VIPVAHGIATASLLEGASLLRFPGCGHFPHRQQPGDFARALAGFVDASDVPKVRIRSAVAASSHARRRRPLLRRAWATVRARVRAVMGRLATRSTPRRSADHPRATALEALPAAPAP
jgi:hypothetical protein